MSSAGHPLATPYAEGMLDVGDGHHIAWEVSGNPDGIPAVVVHGGPGSGRGPRTRRFFDPTRYRIVLFDQRGCGASTPSAAAPGAGLRHNTTHHLVADMERLRVHLGIERWLLLGGSWGSTLILAYAQRHPERVSQIVIPAVTTTRRAEIDWLLRGVGRFFPDQWQRFLDGSRAPGTPHDSPTSGTAHRPSGPNGSGNATDTGPATPPPTADTGFLRDPHHGTDLAAAYAQLLTHPDPDVRDRAVSDWCAWEDTVLSLESGADTTGPVYAARPGPARHQLVRICSQYFAHGAWLDEGELIREAPRLAGIPGVLIHGRHDLGGPPDTAWELARRWPDAELTIVEDAGHLGTETTATLVVAALDRFAAGS